MDIVNKVWPNWHIEELIGEGTFGKVYKVYREDLGHKSYSAVKVISFPQSKSEVNELASSGMDEKSIGTYYEDMVLQLMNEIRIMESVKTADNIVSIEDYQLLKKQDGIGWDIFIRMELLTSLNEYLLSHTLQINEIVQLGINICEALKVCENVQIIHRDIKVENIFINPFGKFKLGDFGIARQLEKTQTALSKKGTSMYMAPEVFKGDSYNHTVDIYSLGIVLYRFLNNGRYPFMPPLGQQISYGDRENSLMQRMRGEILPPPVNADLDLAKIIGKMCAFNPSERYQSAEEAASALTKYSEIFNQKRDVTATEDDGNSNKYAKDIYLVDKEDEKTESVFSNIKTEEEKQFVDELSVEQKNSGNIINENLNQSDIESENQNERQTGFLQYAAWGIIIIITLALLSPLAYVGINKIINYKNGDASKDKTADDNGLKICLGNSTIERHHRAVKVGGKSEPMFFELEDGVIEKNSYSSTNPESFQIVEEFGDYVVEGISEGTGYVELVVHTVEGEVLKERLFISVYNWMGEQSAYVNSTCDVYRGASELTDEKNDKKGKLDSYTDIYVIASCEDYYLVKTIDGPTFQDNKDTGFVKKEYIELEEY